MKALWQGQVIAESSATVVVEGNHYFPRDSIKSEYFNASETHTFCPWKGQASYFTVEVNGQRNVDSAWYYPEPKAKAENIRDYIAFWRGIEICDG